MSEVWRAALPQRAPRDRTHPVVDVLGVSVSAIELPDLLRDIDAALEERHRLTVTFANPNYLVAAAKNPVLRGMINAFDHVLTDGWGVMLAARILGKRIPARLANDDLVVPFFDLLARRRTRVFLLGSAPGVAERAGARLTENFPGVEIAGTMHGYLSVQEGTPGRYSAAAFDRMVQAVNDADPDLLIIGIPTPSQQRFVVENLDRLTATVIMTGGAWLDHIAERMQYYPPPVVKLRLCWAYRWFREPRRLAHRYTVELADFGRRVLAQRARPARRRP
ncbi:MAG TPA: WecB/TagA/CpsF family glycosyltransferase [Streptosporangiales bacterium]